MRKSIRAEEAQGAQCTELAGAQLNLLAIH